MISEEAQKSYIYTMLWNKHSKMVQLDKKLLVDLKKIELYTAL